MRLESSSVANAEFLDSAVEQSVTRLLNPFHASSASAPCLSRDSAMPASTKDRLVWWLKNVGVVIGFLVAVLGGGGSAIQMKAYGSASLSGGMFGATPEDAITNITLAGTAMAAVSAGAAWLVNAVWGKLAKGKGQPFAQYTAAVTAQQILVRYLNGDDADQAMLVTLKASCKRVLTDALDPPAPAPVLEAK